MTLSLDLILDHYNQVNELFGRRGGNRKKSEQRIFNFNNNRKYSNIALAAGNEAVKGTMNVMRLGPN